MVNTNLKHKFKQYKALFLVCIFFLAILVWYSPIIFKGYSVQPISQDILLARNYHETGILAIQNNQSIIISSDLIEEQGYQLPVSQYLRSVLYAKIFNITGVLDYNNLILLSIILYALVFILFVVLILYLFNFKIAIVFSLIYIFSPIGWGLSRLSGAYEFCLLFLALFFIFYFLGAKKTEKSKNKFNNLFFIVSGIFLSLSALSREATLVFALAFFIFLFVKRFKQQLAYIFVPFVLLLVLFWLPSFLSGENKYASLLTNRPTQESISMAELHVFPDAYTYYFEKEEFLEEFKNQNRGWSENIETRKILTNFGFEKFSLFNRIKINFYLLSQHILRFFSLEDFGGPFFSLLLVLGLIYLKNKYKFLYQLSLYWLIISFFVFSFVILVSRNHLMDFIWILILLMSLGLFYLTQIIKNHFKLSKVWTIFLGVIMVGLAIYHLVLVNHVILGKEYDKDFIPRSIAYSQEIEELNISNKEVIAVPGDFPSQGIVLNYLTNKSFVVFRDLTVEKLLEDEKTKQIFKVFEIKYILGFSEELSEKIIEQTGIINIASHALEINIESVSDNRGFLMNLIR
ncbi:hypothetical protein KJ763_00060 [Patescibacteria group bacterium]|nr:hypothetical protein [Patescibacteria group bacterium]